jgi:ribonucleoside-diphosphate reductase beta chain
MIINKRHKAVNWNRATDDFTLMFWEQNLKQFWIDTEFAPSKDKKMWGRLDPITRDTYKKVLGGLTLLDTKQGNVGMPNILDHVDDLQRKAVLSYMSMMENIHAKSYSTIFTTLIEDSAEIDEVFDWVEENKYLQFKADQISYYYENIIDKKSLYMAMVASVFLESFLFYSGFFFPLWLAGQGKLIASGEIINKIVQDESIHGVFVGLLAQELYSELTPLEQEMVDFETYKLLEELMENEERYTEELYTELGLAHEVKIFIQYNANKALMNLGKEPIYEDRKINPIVENALNTESTTHDFFSTKGKGYIKAKHEPLTDKSFDFSDKNLYDDI